MSEVPLYLGGEFRGVVLEVPEGHELHDVPVCGDRVRNGESESE